MQATERGCAEIRFSSTQHRFRVQACDCQLWVLGKVIDSFCASVFKYADWIIRSYSIIVVITNLRLMKGLE